MRLRPATAKAALTGSRKLTPADTLAAWLAEIERRHPADIKLGLERIQAVLRRLGIAEPEPIVITVAGTNGKGSTVAFLERIYREAGYHVGAYTSPHLVRFNERVRVDGAEVADAELCAAFAEVEGALGGDELTYFEFATAAAFAVFAAHPLDVMLLEVGLGGRLDAVNAVDADAAAVVSVALDHIEWLGDDRESIGWEKAHVFRPGVAGVCGDLDPPLRLREHAEEVGARLLVAGRDYQWAGVGEQWHWRCDDQVFAGLPLPAARGTFQLQNAACALALVHSLAERLPVARDQLSRAIEATRVPGRMQRVEGEVSWLFDVAHNVHAAAALAGELRATAPTRDGARTFAVFGMMQDKDCEAVVSLLGEQVQVWLVASLPPPRGVPAAALARAVEKAGGQEVHEFPDVTTAVDAARRTAQTGDRVVVFGSFLTVGPGLLAAQCAADPPSV